MAITRNATKYGGTMSNGTKYGGTMANGIKLLATQALDRLLTQNDCFIVTDESSLITNGIKY